MALIGNKKAQKQVGVGNSYGERDRSQIRNHTAQVSTQRPQAHKPLDKFAGISNKKKNAVPAEFAANATYRSARRFSVKGKPYIRPLSDHLNNGTTHTAGGKAPPSDDAILRFLGKVIERAPANPRIARNKAATKSVASKSVKQNATVKTRAQTTMQEVVKTARPRTTKA